MASVALTSHLSEIVDVPIERRRAERILWRSACTIETFSGLRALGGLFEAGFEGQLFHLFITTNSVLPTISLAELTPAKLIFNVQCQTVKMSLKRHSVRQMGTAQHLNATVVELSAEFARKCHAKGFCFLKIGVSRIDDGVPVRPYLTISFIDSSFLDLQVVNSLY